MLKVSPVQFLKVQSTDDKNWDFTAVQKSVDLLQAATQIHCKIKSQQLLHIESTETVQGPNHRTGERVYPRWVLSHIHVRLPVSGLNLHKS